MWWRHNGTAIYICHQDWACAGHCHGILVIYKPCVRVALYIIQTPRYDSLKLLLSGILRYFLTLQVETSDDENVQAVLIERQRLLQVYIDDFPRNREDKERLISSGYSSNLWNRVYTISNGVMWFYACMSCDHVSLDVLYYDPTLHYHVIPHLNIMWSHTYRHMIPHL